MNSAAVHSGSCVRLWKDLTTRRVLPMLACLKVVSITDELQTYLTLILYQEMLASDVRRRRLDMASLATRSLQ